MRVADRSEQRAEGSLWPQPPSRLATALASTRGPAPAQTADTIYVGGDIVTINDAQPTAEALAVKDGKILAVGARAEIEKAAQGRDDAGRGPRRQDAAAGLPRRPQPLHQLAARSPTRPRSTRRRPGRARTWTASSPSSRSSPTERKIPKGELIMAYGYDDTVMPDGRLLNRDDLDAGFPDNPVRVDHVSMHGAVHEQPRAEEVRLSAPTTKTPPGGVIVRKPGTNEPYGLIMETAFLPVFEQCRADDAGAGDRVDQGRPDALRRGRHHHRPRGRDPPGAASQTMKRATDAGANIIDVVAYPVHHRSRQDPRRVPGRRRGASTTSASRSAASRSRSTARRRAGPPSSPRPT